MLGSRSEKKIQKNKNVYMYNVQCHRHENRRNVGELENIFIVKARRFKNIKNNYNAVECNGRR